MANDLICRESGVMGKTCPNAIGVCKNYIEDEKDIPYLAVCLACNVYGIWTHDPDFLKQKKVKILANIDMLRLSRQV